MRRDDVLITIVHCEKFNTMYGMVIRGSAGRNILDT